MSGKQHLSRKSKAESQSDATAHHSPNSDREAHETAHPANNAQPYMADDNLLMRYNMPYLQRIIGNWAITRALNEVAQPNAQQKEDSTILISQNDITRSRSGSSMNDYIQKFGSMAPGAAYNATQQTERRQIAGRAPGTPRPANIAQLVDQYKKEMLTYIASRIERRRRAAMGPGAPAHPYGPHIAVIIVGDRWYVSVNSNIGNTANLQNDANAVKNEINVRWNHLHNTYGPTYNNPAPGIPNTPATEAAYIAFRWAATKANVQVILPPAPGGGGVHHGEMRIINDLQGLAALPARVFPGGVGAPAAIAVPPGHNRVVRVGGTKTPCLDCAWEMGPGLLGVPILTNAPNAHIIGPPANHRAQDIHGRTVTPMTNEHGLGFPHWQHPVGAGERTGALVPGDPNYNAHQNQDYAALRAAFNTTAPANPIL